MNRDWLEHLQTLCARGEACVLLTLARTEGSTPREAGTRMLVTADASFGTIGGGQLEYTAIKAAREMLAQPGSTSRLRQYTLGTALGQCCGGVVWLLAEPLRQRPPWLQPLRRMLDAGAGCHLLSRTDAPDKLLLGAAEVVGSLGEAGLDREARAALAEATTAPSTRLLRLRGLADTAPLLCESLQDSDSRVIVFGAGHVGQALVGLLAELPFRVCWVDHRAGQIPTALPSRVRACTDADVLNAVEQAPAGSRFLIMTHSHDLDFAICHRVLQRDDFAYCGLIGSHSKRMRFEHRLRDLGISAERLARLRCPIGVEGISDKRPQAVAVAVAAELLQSREAAASQTDRGRRVS